jgi:hypothetical protein
MIVSLVFLHYRFESLCVCMIFMAVVPDLAWCHFAFCFWLDTNRDILFGVVRGVPGYMYIPQN